MSPLLIVSRQSDALFGTRLPTTYYYACLVTEGGVVHTCTCTCTCLTGAREAAFRNIKSIAECLADELMNAAKVTNVD